LAKARAAPSSPRITRMLSPNISSVRQSPALAMSLAWQTICQEGRISRAISTRKYSGS
jgi:hypothetical protein